MKEFEVTITKTLQKSITVEAATREEAQAMVEEMWDKGDVVLDADHFVSAEFSCNDGQEIEADKPIEVLLVEPGQYARMTTIGSSLEDMQKVVGGYIQEAPFFRDPVTLVCNEEGKISGLPLNRAIRDDDGKIIDVVAGTFFICGAEGDHFSSIPKELQKKVRGEIQKAGGVSEDGAQHHGDSHGAHSGQSEAGQESAGHGAVTAARKVCKERR